MKERRIRGNKVERPPQQDQLAGGDRGEEGEKIEKEEISPGGQPSPLKENEESFKKNNPKHRDLTGGEVKLAKKHGYYY